MYRRYRYIAGNLKIEKVYSGEDATAPSVPTREGYVFDRWDQNFSNVSTNLFVTAIYTKNKDTTAITIDSASVKPGDIVEISMLINNNPGIAGIEMYFSLDPALSLIEASEGELILCENSPFGFLYSELNAHEFSIMIDSNGPAFYDDGVICHFKFKVADNVTPGNELGIHLTNETVIIDENLDELDIKIVESLITVE